MKQNTSTFVNHILDTYIGNIPSYNSWTRICDDSPYHLISLRHFRIFSDHWVHPPFKHPPEDIMSSHWHPSTACTPSQRRIREQLPDKSTTLTSLSRTAQETMLSQLNTKRTRSFSSLLRQVRELRMRRDLTRIGIKCTVQWWMFIRARWRKDWSSYTEGVLPILWCASGLQINLSSRPQTAQIWFLRRGQHLRHTVVLE